MLLQGQVGPITTTSSIAAGTWAPVRQGQLGETIMQELHGRYYETGYRRALFNAANQTGIVTTVGLATTYTGLCLSNPVGSGWNISLNKVGLSFQVAFPAASSVGLMCGYNASTNVTHTAAGTPRSNFFGIGAAGVGLVDTSAGLPTAPVITHLFGTGLTGIITTAQYMPSTLIDLEGSVILPPGGYAAIYTSTVTGAASMLASFQWEELPV
jgi:hypothetical protein